MGDPSPCREGSDGPGAILTHPEWVTGAPGRSLWVPVAGVWFLLCPSQDPAQGLGPGVCLAAGLQILPCCSPASKYFLLSADYWEYTGSIIPYTARIHRFWSCCGFFLSFPLQLLLEHEGKVKMKYVYSLLCEL